MRKILALGLVAVLVLSAVRAGREEAARRDAPARVAVVLSVGGLGDRSFNDLAHQGLLAAVEELGVAGVWGEPADHAEDEEYLDLYAREGYDLVVALGYLMKSKLAKVAPRHPDTWFVLVDEALSLENVRSYTFREEEGCFLVGALAAMKSESGVIGFVGGLDIPLLRRFLTGYARGARYVRPGIEVLDSWAGSFSDPQRGKEKALAQHDRGADVVFQAAGATGNGVIQAASEQGFFAIGVDANQNDMAPGNVLTSMRKKVEEAVRRSAEDLVAGRMTAGVLNVGMAEGMIGWSLDEHNRALVSPEMERRVGDLSRRIVGGEIEILEGGPVSAPAVELIGIVKRYPGILANDGADFSAERGEVHAVVGENGAGKTTLMRVLAGLTRPDAGAVRVVGRPARLRSAAEAAAAGIGMVHQHFTLVPVFTVLENFVLGREPLLLRRLEGERETLLRLARETGLAVDPDARVGSLTVGEQQRVEILRTLGRGAEILILDEPTAVLAPAEARSLFRTLRRLAEGGRAVVFISHRLSEVLQASDRITVMRQGRRVATVETASATEGELARLMVGREVVLATPRARDRPPGDVTLQVSDLRALDTRGLPAVAGIDLSVRSGEVVGIAGVMGNGQRELLETILGLTRAAGGSVRVAGRDVTGLSVQRRLETGLAYVPEDRQGRGLVLGLSAEENLALGLLDDAEVWRGPFLRAGSLRARAGREMEALDVRPPNPRAVAGTLSGGNQQKIVLARAMAGAPDVLLLAEPTRGLDVLAIERVHAAIRRARDRGAAILLVSSDLAELLDLSDRLLVMRGGRIVGSVEPGRTDEEALGLMMTGGER